MKIKSLLIYLGGGGGGQAQPLQDILREINEGVD